MNYWIIPGASGLITEERIPVAFHQLFVLGCAGSTQMMVVLWLLLLMVVTLAGLGRESLVWYGEDMVGSIALRVSSCWLCRVPE
jgi:hypothetical protein